MMNGPLETLREACARELEWMARGYVVAEHMIIKEAAERIRNEIVLTDSNSIKIVLNAIAIVIDVSDNPQHKWYLFWDNKDGLQSVMCDRIRAINVLDPMEPFSDKQHWWPREYPEIPEWVVAALDELNNKIETEEGSLQDLKSGSPARHFANGRTNGLRWSSDVVYKHMPPRPAGSLCEFVPICKPPVKDYSQIAINEGIAK